MFSNGCLLVYFLVLMMNIFQVSDYLLYKSNVEMNIIENIVVVNHSVNFEKKIITLVESIDYDIKEEQLKSDDIQDSEDEEIIHQYYIDDHLITINNIDNIINVIVQGEFCFNMEIELNAIDNRAMWYKLN